MTISAKERLTDVDMVGQKFVQLTVVERHDRASWKCVCDCGKAIVVIIYRLLSGNTKSCGCLRRTNAKQLFTKHGGCGSPEYRAYLGAIKRCTDPEEIGYKNYGGRGIEFRFQSFEQFFAELGPRPSAKYSVDRIDVNGHYEPGNIRWETKNIQRLNQRKRDTVSKNGYVGVHKAKTGERYEARIGIGGKLIHLRTCSTKEEAARVYDEAALLYHGEYAKLNFPDEANTDEQS